MHNSLLHIIMLLPQKVDFLLIFFSHVYSLPQKKVYTFAEPSTQNCGGQMKSRGSAKPTITLFQTGPSLILKFKKMAASFRISKRGLVQIGPAQWSM